MNKGTEFDKLLEDYRAKWSKRIAPSQEKTENNLAIWRGSIPCEVVFLGEAQGHEESKKLLDKLLGTLSKELSTYGVEFRYLICSVLEDTPDTAKSGTSNIKTTGQSSRSLPQITELLKLAKPKLLVPLGKAAEEQAKGLFKGAVLQGAYHPSYVLRNGGEKSEKYRTLYNKVSKAVCRVYAKGEGER